MPRSLSFTATMQSLAVNWLLVCVINMTELVKHALETSVSQTVGHRPDRIEPRANRRRKKMIGLLRKPRTLAKMELINPGT